MERVYACLGGIFLAASLLFAIPVHAQSPQDILAQYVADLKNKPNEYALREKIIKHVQTMSPAPVIPEEAERHMARGSAAIKNAKNADDFRDAVNEFKKATLAAPWLASAYYNLGIAQDKAGKYADAIKSLRLYLSAAPEAPDAKAVKNLMYEIEYKQEKSAKESSPGAIAEKRQDPFETLLRKIDGRRYTYPFDDGETGVIDVRGKVFVSRMMDKSGNVGSREVRTEIQGRETTSRVSPPPTEQFFPVAWIFIISEDGDRITSRRLFKNGNYREMIYLWQR